MFVIYGRKNCNWCSKAEILLESLGKDYRYIDINKDERSRAYLQAEGHNTVPQIYANGSHIGGYIELEKMMETNNDES